MVAPKIELRIAYADTSRATWTGGGTYRRNLLTALQQYAPHVKVHILTEKNPDTADFESDAVIQYRQANGLINLVDKASARWLGYDLSLRQTLRHVPGGSDVVFPGWHKIDVKTAVLGWIPDFQHLYLPEMYSKPQLASLDKKFMKGAKRVTLMVLSSHDAEKDFRAFAPAFAHKARVMHFVARIPEKLYDSDPGMVTTRYHLPDKFFYLPNQFWKHKNHIIVFEALHILKQKNIKPFVVFTGNPVDPRNPLHLANLMEKLSEWNLRDQVAFLGLVPHDYVYHLIRQSSCVLNPSLFEGWSTTVEESKSVGKRMIISDLPVHREQSPPQTEYFDPHNAEELADKLAEAWQNYAPGPDLELEAQARVAFPQRMKTYAETFVAIAAEAAQIVRR